MTFLPIVLRELRVASRLRSTYWVRASAALLAIGIGAWFFMVARQLPETTMARSLFGLLTGSATLFALFSGLRFTADSLSREKREGTLGLLFLTDLKGYDVILGKLAATSLNAVCGLLAVVPALAIPMLLGGVTVTEVGRMSIVALNTLFFSLACGLFASAACREANKASALCVSLILLFTALLPAVGLWIAVSGSVTARIHPAFLLGSPGATYTWALESTLGLGARGFWWSLLTVHGLAWLFLVLASLLVPRAWQDKASRSPRTWFHSLPPRLKYGSTERRTALRRRLLDENPFLWLVARVRTRPLLVWAFVLAVCGCWFWGWTENKDYWLEPQVGALTCFVLAVVLKFWLAAEACRQIVEQRTAGTLEVLLSTPMKIEEILRGQLGGLQRQFAAPALFTLGLCALFYFGGLKQVEIPRDATEWTWLWVSGAVVFGADLVALYFVGMWEALRVLNPQRAASNAVARVLVLPWVAFAGIMLGLSILSMNSEVSFPSYSPIALWLVLSLVTDFAFGIWARGRLLHRFRQTAGERHSGGKGRAENSLTSAKP